MLARRGATAFAATDDFALPIGELAEQIEILVVDVHRTRTFAVDENRILLLGPNLILVRPPLRGSFELLKCHV